MTKPDQTINMTLRMAKIVEATEVIEVIEVIEAIEAIKCQVAIEGLFWQDEATEEFDISSDITEYVESALI